jgi:hypothetical protein
MTAERTDMEARNGLATASLGALEVSQNGHVACESCGATENVEHSEQIGVTYCGPCFERRAERASRVKFVTAQNFAAVEEPGADALLGEPGEVLIPEGGDVMIYGDGGASKTTLTIDLAFHLAAGDHWLEIPVKRPTSVALIEVEGPRPLFRQKIARKLSAWQGSDIGDRLRILAEPWANFRFSEAELVAERLGDLEVDVLIAGPLTRVGMDELGTLQQVRDFMGQVADFRERSGRQLTIFLVHHENKGGAVSGAWEGAGDTLLHAQVHARGKTTLTVQKARWSGEWHKQKLELAWTDGEGFEICEEEERDLIEEISAYLVANPHRTTKEISSNKEGGIGARLEEVRTVLEANQDRFKSLTKEGAKAVGRHPSATVWELIERSSQGRDHLGSPPPSREGGSEGVEVIPPYRGSPTPGAPSLLAPKVSPDAGSPRFTNDSEAAA